MRLSASNRSSLNNESSCTELCFQAHLRAPVTNDSFQKHNRNELFLDRPDTLRWKRMLFCEKFVAFEYPVRSRQDFIGCTSGWAILNVEGRVHYESSAMLRILF